MHSGQGEQTNVHEVDDLRSNDSPNQGSSSELWKKEESIAQKNGQTDS